MGYGAGEAQGGAMACRRASFATLMGVVSLAATLSTLGAAAALSAPRRGAAPAIQVIQIDGAGAGPVFDGLGAVSAGASSRLLIDYPEPQRSQILDYLFKPGYGAALQHLKVEIGADVNSTDGSEPSQMRTPADHDYDRGYEWWLMSEARKRNPQIILDSLPWGAPGWIGNGRLYSHDMANYVADFLEGAAKKHSLNIAYTGVWNERVYDAEYVKQLRGVLDADGLSTKIVCCDEYPGEGAGQWAMVSASAADPALNNAISVFSVHYPWIYNTATTPAEARASAKPLWSSEDQPNSGGGPILSRDWAQGGRLLAKLYNRNYLEGGFTKTEIWSPITSYYEILAAPHSGLMYANTPWSGNYKVQSAIWVTAHTTQFAQPGWRYDDASCGYLQHGGSYVTFLSPDRSNWSTVLETIDARQAQSIRLRVTGGLSGSAIHVWETNGAKTFVHLNDLRPQNGFFTLTVDPDSLYTFTTTTGQGKGDAEPPPPAPFPARYSDDFESVKLGGTTRYLSDQDGAFEAQPCRFRPGNCLMQVITDKPIPWSPLPDPFTLTGDSNWRNYSVAVDAQIPNAGIASLFGRIDSANVFADGKALYPSGYGLLLKSNGDWRLISTAYRRSEILLASGAVKIAPGSWAHMELDFADSSLSASIDGTRIAEVSDSTHSRGMFSIGSNWTQVQFDNLRASEANQSGPAGQE